MRALLVALASGGHALRVPQLASRRAPQRCCEPLLLASATVKDAIQQTTAGNQVVIYSKSWCPYCAQCKALFDDMSQPYTAIELDEREEARGERSRADAVRVREGSAAGGGRVWGRLPASSQPLPMALPGARHSASKW